MKNWNVILGVDVSKLTLDIGCSEQNLHIKIDNNPKGFGKFTKWCKTNDIDLKETLVVMEYTGGYEYGSCNSVTRNLFSIAGYQD